MYNQEKNPYELSRTSFNIWDEVLKLRLIVQESSAPIHPSYLLEKIDRTLRGIPIALDPGKQTEFNLIKRGR